MPLLSMKEYKSEIESVLWSQWEEDILVQNKTRSTLFLTLYA